MCIVSLVFLACGSGRVNGQPPGAPATATGSPAVFLTVASGRPDMVSGGSVLVFVTVPPGVPAKTVRLSVDGVDVPSSLRRTRQRSVYEARIDGLHPGTHVLQARARNGQQSERLTVTNHPSAGPVFSGPHSRPFECRTQESGLGDPLDENCAAAPRHDWFYVTTTGAKVALPDPLGPRPADLATTTTWDGQVVPFIVRIESGTLNRSIYRIAVLDSPSTAGQWNASGWNQRVILRFGESTGAQYNQGVSRLPDVFKEDAADPQSMTALGRGFAYITSSLNVHKVNVNDVVAAETAMMLREHVAKTYGVPRWMLGMGGSGGAIQQMLIAQNYPGILDGIMPDAAFPDVFGTLMAVSDCRLLNRHFEKSAATDATRRAFEGHLKGACATWDKAKGDVIVATRGSVAPACGLQHAAWVYDPVTNPGGARCTVQDLNAVSLGRDPQGRAHRPLDNVGVQYGLESLRKGIIGMDDFLALNEQVGGYDVDGNWAQARTVADPQGLRRAHASGRVGSGGGGLATVPIMHMRAYAEPAGDIHTLDNDFKIRQQLVRANGQADNQVIWLLPHPHLARVPGQRTAPQPVLTQLLRETFIQRLDLMTHWLDALQADPDPLTPAKLAKHKPVDAVDSCWHPVTTERHREPATLDGPGTCHALYPKTPSPRRVAGAPVTDDVLKCRLKPLDDADYGPAGVSSAHRQRLQALFPDGVCDYAQPGVGQVPLQGTWLRY
jgi:hypothetical protein